MELRAYMPYLAFNEVFFKKHQKRLLWLLNSRLTKRWFRWILRIRKYDCDIDKKITGIGPNRFFFGDRLFFKNNKFYIERTADFRTHAKFGKRIYYAFRPLWWIMHAWDSLFADIFVPSLSFGFDTLTVYPEAGSGATTVDGVIYKFAVDTYANVRNSATGTVDKTSATGPSFVGNLAGGGGFEVDRGYTTFDTSALGAAALISAATISIEGVARFNGDSDSVNCYSVTLANNNDLVTGDFNISNFGSTQFATSITFASWDTAAYNVFTLNANGIANISKTGVSAFGWRTVKEVAATQPGGDTYITSRWADTAGTTSDPKLVITYSVALNIDINDAVTVAENIATGGVDLGDISVNDAVTVAENIATGGVDLGDISVNDAVTVAESLLIDFPFDIFVSDSVIVSESVSADNTNLGDISANDAITVSENVSITVSAARRGLVIMRSTEQSRPIPMSNTQQGRPITLDDNRIM